MIRGKSPSLLEVTNAARVVAATGVNTVLYGETGTGRELLARFVHAHSSRYEQPFVSVNCASIPQEQVEALLFGLCKNSSEDHKGYIESAANGTLYLSEVEQLPQEIQTKLLSFLKSGEIYPLGSPRPIKLDVRLIVASQNDLGVEVEQGTFSQDLYYQLNVVPLNLPPLRERQGDITILLGHFVSLLSTRHGLKSPHFSKAALSCLKNYYWPGNVRELRNLCERLVILLPGQEVGVQNLPQELKAAPVSNERTSDSVVKLPPEGISLAVVEESLIRQALELTNGNQSKAARLLGISRDTLLYRLKKFAIS
jgi:DNA-binding NtrC family response regulator